MTVDASIETARATDALVVPINALDYRGAPQPSAASSSPWGSTGADRSATPTAGSRATVTVIDGKASRDVPVRVILIGGGEAAIAPIGRSLAVGSRVAVTIATRSSAPATTRVSNPLR